LGKFSSIASNEQAAAMVDHGWAVADDHGRVSIALLQPPPSARIMLKPSPNPPRAAMVDHGWAVTDDHGRVSIALLQPPPSARIMLPSPPREAMVASQLLP
jgi:hypothetical protein